MSVPEWIIGSFLVAAAAVALARGLLQRNETHRLRSASTSLTSALESMTDGIVVVSLEGTIERYNSEFARIVKADSRVPLVGQRLDSLDPWLAELESPDCFLAHIEKLNGQPRCASEETLAIKDGRVFEGRSWPRLVDDNVAGRVWCFRDITNASRVLSELSHQTFHDSLTGLANRDLLRDRLEHAVARARRSLSIVAVLVLEIDGFDVINNTLGHEIGDQLLVAFAERLEQQTRESDTIARLGAHEFAVVVDQTTTAGGLSLAGRIDAMLNEPFLLQGRQVYTRVSIGLADNASDALDASDLLCRADIAMHAAKAAGGDRVEIFEDVMQTDLMQRQTLYHDLRHALRNDELRVYYQPRLDLATNQVASLEALLRWRHPTLGLVGPNQIIPIAEETGLIVEIGRWVVRESCRQLMEWSDVLRDDVSLSVNISPRQLFDDGFIDDVTQALSDSGVAGSRLILELTEGSLLANLGLMEEPLKKLRALDVRVAIDDFGVGYSSLNYLQSVALLKIDRKFVQEYTQDESNRGGQVVRSMVSIAQKLGIGVVAEGIEEEVELVALRGLGCEAGQGYLFAPPLPPDQIPLAVTRLNRAPALADSPAVDTTPFDSRR